MSEYLSAAAAALGAPELIVQRSADAKAKATGASADDILKAWAGGEAVAAPAAPPAAAEPEPAPEPAPAPEPTPDPEPTPAPAPADTPADAPVVVEAAPPASPPVLTGRKENPFLALAAAVGLFATVLLIGFVAPAVPAEGNGVYSSAIPLSESGQAGRDVYLREGCAACHTQQVRPIVSDAGLGGVTLSDSNQVLGSHRYGPDLAAVGARVESDASLIRVLEGAGDHPGYQNLSDDDLLDLVSYLLESR